MNTTSGNLPWGGDGPEAGSLGLLESKNTIKLVIAAVTSMWLLNSYLYNHKDIRAPIVGYRNFWEPTFVLRLRYIQGAWAITTDGYKKVLLLLKVWTKLELRPSQFKDSMFTICRNDTNILMISNKYVQELRALPNAQLGATAGLVKVGFHFLGTQHNGRSCKVALLRFYMLEFLGRLHNNGNHA